MNRWTLLEHTICKREYSELHYDFLVENGLSCLTWKLFQIPILNGSVISITKQDNHRLIWLYRDKKILSRGRGIVKRKDCGTYSIINQNLSSDNFSLMLNGQILKGLFNKRDNSCRLISHK